MVNRPKRPKDPNELAFLITEMATGEINNDSPKNTNVHVTGRKGGLVGGNIRAEKLSPEKRKDIASKAAKARWAKQNKH